MLPTADQIFEQSLADFQSRRATRFGDPAHDLVEFLASPAAPVRNGIDGAHWQGFPDWSTVAAAGVQWASWKATHGASAVDATFSANWSGMRLAGIRYRLAYHWIDPAASAAAQAEHFAAVVGALQPGEGILLDAEQDGVTEQLVFDIVQQLRMRFPSRSIVVYTGLYVAGGTIWRSAPLRALGCRFVLAAYTTWEKAHAAAQPFTIHAWQFAGPGGTCPGVAGEVDNDWIPDLTAFDTVCGYPSPQEDDEMKTLPTPTRVFDSRTSTGRLHAGQTTKVTIEANVVGVNLTVVGAGGPGYLVAWGAGSKPATSNVNFAGPAAVSNFAQVALDAGVLHLQATQDCHVIVDLQAAG